MTISLGGQILQSDSGGRASLRSGVIEVADGQIVGVQFGKVSAQVDFGDPETLISPGFIDTHLHLPQFDSIGAAGMQLLPWLGEVIFPAEQHWNDLDWAKSMIQRVAAQCLSVGTTGICAYGTSSHDATIAALTAFRELGFRGVIGQVMMDSGEPPSLSRPAAQLIEEVNQSLEQFPPAGRMAAAVTPRFALSCSEALMRQAGELAAQHDAMVQTHLAETVAECAEVARRFEGQPYVEVYRQAGLLGPRSLLGHGIHLDPPSQRVLAETDSIIVHCPTANSFLGSGMMNRHSHLESGIRVSLGSDIGAGFERSMVRVGRSMIETAMRVALDNDHAIDDTTHVPTAAEAWHQITAGNADLLDWEDAGRIQVGASADLVLIRPDLPWQETRSPLSTLMFAWDDRWIKATFLQGRMSYGADAESGRQSP